MRGLGQAWPARNRTEQLPARNEPPPESPQAVALLHRLATTMAVALQGDHEARCAAWAKADTCPTWNGLRNPQSLYTHRLRYPSQISPQPDRCGSTIDMSVAILRP